MNHSLFATAPDFDEPLAVLKHCHDRIRKQLRTLDRLGALQNAGQNPEARQAAESVLRYFEQAAPLHHEDEENDLLPMLQQTAKNEDAATLAALTPGILAEHRQMDALWEELAQQLRALAAGEGDGVSASQVQAFASTYHAHMEREETHIATMAKRLFSTEQMQRLGNAMRSRRGLTTQEG